MASGSRSSTLVNSADDIVHGSNERVHQSSLLGAKPAHCEDASSNDGPQYTLDFAMSLRSQLTLNDERVLRHNYDFPLTVCLHFAGPNTGAIPSPNDGDIYVHERMFLAGLRFPFLVVVRVLLSSLGLSPYQILPNAWKFFFASDFLWPTFFKGRRMTVLEFLTLYCPLHSRIGLVNFKARGRNHFITLTSPFSNNKSNGVSNSFLSRVNGRHHPQRSFTKAGGFPRTGTYQKRM